MALTRRTLVGKVMSLLFNMLYRLLITFLPRSKRLLISWLQSPSAVILEPPKIKPDTVSPSIFHEVMGLGAMIFVFRMLNFKPSFSLSTLHFQGDFGGLVLVCIGTACCPCLAGHCRQKHPIWPQEKYFLFVESFPLGLIFFFLAWVRPP